MKFKTIAIVGLGFMGGSLAAACRKKFPKGRILGISRDRKALVYARKRHWIHEGFQNVDDAIKKGAGSFFFVLCTPVDTLQSLLEKIDKSAPSGTLVTDVGSVKGEIVRWAGRRRFRHIRFIGAHPMTGSHERGIAAARPDLYEGSFTFVTPGLKGSPLDSIMNFWQKIGSRVVALSAEEHDQIMGEISHLPHLAAVCQALTPGKKSLRRAGPGFLDATRIAQGHPSIWAPIFLANRLAVLKALRLFETQIRRFRKALLGGRKKRRDLEKILAEAAKRRGSLVLRAKGPGGQISL